MIELFEGHCEIWWFQIHRKLDYSLSARTVSHSDKSGPKSSGVHRKITGYHNVKFIISISRSDIFASPGTGITRQHICENEHCHGNSGNAGLWNHSGAADHTGAEVTQWSDYWLLTVKVFLKLCKWLHFLWTGSDWAFLSVSVLSCSLTVYTP